VKENPSQCTVRDCGWGCVYTPREKIIHTAALIWGCKQTQLYSSDLTFVKFIVLPINSEYICMTSDKNSTFMLHPII
jgi:hypothetical protein